MTGKTLSRETFVTLKPTETPTLCLFFTGNCPIKPPCCLCGHIIRSSCFIGYYYKAFQAFFCNHIIQFHDHFLLIIPNRLFSSLAQCINICVFLQNDNWGRSEKSGTSTYKTVIEMENFLPNNVCYFFGILIKRSAKEK